MAQVEFDRRVELEALEAERAEEQQDRRTAWIFFWVLFVFKIVTVLLMIWAAGLSSEAALILSMTTWPWLIIPVIGIAGPLLYRVRLRRIRSRRDQLRRSEWMLDG
jgi:hypothetical protein